MSKIEFNGVNRGRWPACRQAGSNPRPTRLGGGQGGRASRRTIDMQFKAPKNTNTHLWTKHAFAKMNFYGLSAQRILRVINYPQRKELGIAENTIAVMQPASIKKIIPAGKKAPWNNEIWVMYKTIAQSSGRQPQIQIISAWRYPGVSPQKNPIPDDIIREAINIQ